MTWGQPKNYKREFRVVEEILVEENSWLTVTSDFNVRD